MTVKEIEERVANLKPLVRNEAHHHLMRTSIYVDVLEAIAEGVKSPKPESLAKAALGR